ncbi:class I SAM-dependent methyltransferase [Chitinibacter sp. SCUT-21]|uniref:class I SAM-dependent methyltransferase n=1 Tax=Chitinibacter sp. SCUT-21 TaxID=2970891 RepID=UPI0035A72B95
MLTSSQKRKIGFEPNIYSLLTNPFYIARAGLYHSVKAQSHHAKGFLLDLGCGSKPYQEIFKTCTYIGIEKFPTKNQNSTADIYYNGSHLPFSDNTFDTILISQVLEHIFEPDEFLSELTRVAKPSAKIIITIPFFWAEHEQPHDYARYTSFGISKLLNDNRLSIISQTKVGNSPNTILQTILSSIYDSSKNLPRPLRLILLIAASFTLNPLSLIFKFFSMPDSIFLDQVIVAQRINHA